MQPSSSNCYIVFYQPKKRQSLQTEDGTCNFCNEDIEDPSHAFFECSHSRVAGLALLGWVQLLCPNLQTEDALVLQLGGALDDVNERAAVYTIATGLVHILRMRKIRRMRRLRRMGRMKRMRSMRTNDEKDDKDDDK